MITKKENLIFYEDINRIKDCIPMHIERAKQDSTIFQNLYLHEYKENIFLIKNYLKNDDIIIDIGSGLGTLPAILSTYGNLSVGGDVMKPDWQLKLWEKLSEKFGCFLFIYDGRFLPFKNDTFDVIIAYAVIEHIPEGMKGVSKFIVECNRVLKKDGYLFIFKCPRKQSWTEFVASVINIPHHENLIDEKEIIDIFKQNCFDVIDMKRKDMVPEYMFTKIGQKIWNFFWRPLNILDKFLEYTPLNYFAHNITIILRKK